MRHLAILAIVAVACICGNAAAQEKRTPRYKGKTAREWIPLLAVESERYAAAHALEELGPEGQKEAAAFLADMLHDRDSDYRAFAASSLYHFAEHAQPAVPDLLPLLADKSTSSGNGNYRVVAQGAAYTLCKINLDAAKVLPDLLRYLKGRDLETCALACTVIGSLGPRGKDAVEPLTKALERRNAKVQYYAVVALGDIGPAAAPAIPLITKTMRDPKYHLGDIGRDSFVSRCLEALGKIGPASVPALIDSWDLVAGIHGGTILHIVGKIGPEAKQAVPLLEKSLADPRRECRRDAAFAIWRIEKRKEMVAYLLNMLEYAVPGPDGDPLKATRQVDDEVREILGQLGKDARPALAALERLFTEEKVESTRLRYLATIRAIDPATAARLSEDLPEEAGP